MQIPNVLADPVNQVVFAQHEGFGSLGGEDAFACSVREERSGMNIQTTREREGDGDGCGIDESDHLPKVNQAARCMD
ncbi:MAG: hypothetical protein ACPGWQ_02440, partial [Poseidonia sp.]